MAHVPWAGQDPRAARTPRADHDPRAAQDQWAGQDLWADQAPRQAYDPRAAQAPWAEQDPRGAQAPWGEQGSQGGQGAWTPRNAGMAGQGYPQQGFTPQAGGRQAARGAADPRAAETDRAVAADRRLSSIGFGRVVLVGAAQILALLPGISRDGIVTVAGMWRGLSREDAVRFSFLLSAPVILAAGALKVHDLFGPLGKGIHGPVLVGSLLAGIAAFLSVRFLTRYFSEDRSLTPFGIYCLIAGIGSLAYLVLK
jgi:Bacitracin resistance protein BacA